jgi:hypothetical protein
LNPFHLTTEYIFPAFLGQKLQSTPKKQKIRLAGSVGADNHIEIAGHP